jgi:hypothetical protein
MKVKVAIAAVAAAFVVSGCGAENTPSFMRSGPDLGQVLDRTVKALGSYQNYLRKIEVKSATPEHIKEMTGLFRQVMNMNPKLHRSPIGIELHKDASFIGFEDRNDDNVRDAGEKKLFKVEIDYEGRRLIATSDEYSTAVRPQSSGFFLGIMMSNFERRQRSVGIERNAFANRNVAALRSSRSVTGNGTRSDRSGLQRTSTRSYSARSRTRSGGLFSGK